MSFGNATTGTTPAPVSERLTVVSDDAGGYAVTVRRTAFLPADLPLGIAGTAPSGGQLGGSLAGGATAAIPITPAPDLLVGNDRCPERHRGRRLEHARRVRLAASRRPAGTLHGNRHLHGDRSMRRAAGLALATVVLVPASAGAGTTRPPLALTATPAHVALAGSGQATVRVTNAGLSPVVVDVARAGFSLDLRGRPKVVPRGGPRASVPWLTVRPGRFVLRPGAGRSLTVASRLPGRVEPGDHDAVVLLTTRPQRGAAVAVRVRIGIVVVVRAPGRIVRRVTLGALRVRRGKRARILELGVVNHGNVTETLDRGWLRVSLRRGTAQAMLPADPRELRPRTRGVVQLLYRGRLRGWVAARVRMAGQPGLPVVWRTVRIRL